MVALKVTFRQRDSLALKTCRQPGCNVNENRAVAAGKTAEQ